MSDTDYQNDFLDYSDEEWFSHEGQLSVDVVETIDKVIIRSAVAGVQSDDIDITLANDTLTIRGHRHHEIDEEHEGVTHVKECYWGAFSRSIVLPCSVNPDEVDAVLKNGILIVTLKKVNARSRVPVIDLEDL
jgi:HSP20 family protein